MTFRFDPEHLRNEMFQVPGSATTNGLTADGWTVLAVLESQEKAGILDALADKEVAGYTMPVRGGSTRTGVWQLYVDSTKYNRAEEILMDYLRGKTKPPPGASTRAAVPSTPHPVLTSVRRIWAIRAVRLGVQIVFGALVFGGLLWFLYLYGETRFPEVRPR
jgi:hypothetical protein